MPTDFITGALTFSRTMVYKVQSAIFDDRKEHDGGLGSKTKQKLIEYLNQNNRKDLSDIVQKKLNKMSNGKVYDYNKEVEDILVMVAMGEISNPSASPSEMGASSGAPAAPGAESPAPAKGYRKIDCKKCNNTGLIKQRMLLDKKDAQGRNLLEMTDVRCTQCRPLAEKPPVDGKIWFTPKGQEGYPYSKMMDEKLLSKPDIKRYVDLYDDKSSRQIQEKESRGEISRAPTFSPSEDPSKAPSGPY